MSGSSQPPSIELAQQRLGFAIKDSYRIEKLERVEPAYHVFRAVEISSERLVMAFQVLPKTAQRKGYLDRFQSDVRKLQRLRAHPAFPEVLDFCADSPEQCYLITTYPAVTDVTLSKQLARGLPLPLPKALHNLGRLGEALDAAHREGLVHYHLSPECILLSDDENGERTLRVLGFGLLQHGTDALGGKSGSEYLTPEQLRNEPTDARTDQFVLAAIAYEMLSGRKAFAHRGDTQEQIREKILREDPLPIPLSHAREGLINSALNKSFSKARQQRHASVIEFCYELGLSVERRPQAPVPYSNPGIRRRSWRTAMAWVVLIAIIGFGAAMGAVLRSCIKERKRNKQTVVPAKVDMSLPAADSGPVEDDAPVDMSADSSAPATRPPDLGSAGPRVTMPPVKPIPPKVTLPPPVKPTLPEQYVYRYESAVTLSQRQRLEQCLRSFALPFTVDLVLVNGRYRASLQTISALQTSNALRTCLDGNFVKGELPDPLTIHKERMRR